MTADGNTAGRQRVAGDRTRPLAEDDDDPEGAALRTTDEANEQGAHRFARGHTYYEVARERAEELGVGFRWQLDTVPELGHSNADMAPAAAQMVAGHR